MPYCLTPEQVAKIKSQYRNVFIILWAVLAAFGLAFAYPFSLHAFSPESPHAAATYVFCVVIPLVIVLTYIASSEEWMGKQVLEVEVGPNTLILMKKKNRVEVGYETIKSMLISTDPLDHPKMIFLVLDHPTGSGKDRLPYLFLRGFEGMDRLALELGKKIPDPKSVTRAHVEADQSKMFRFQLKFWVAIVGVLALMAVAIFLFLKSGQGRLLVPLLLIISGLFQFAGAKGKRNDRWLGIVFIIGGLLWGAFKLLEPLLNR